MFKIKIVIDRTPTVAEDSSALEVDSLHAGAPVLHRVGHAIRRAPGEHRVVTFLVFSALWAVFEFFLHYEAAAHTVEVFGVVPFADQAVKVLFGVRE
jgi:hypothetical protein